MSFSFGTSMPAQPTLGFGSTPAKAGFGTSFAFGNTPATTATTGFSGFGSFGTPASTTTSGFGSTFGTPATSTTGFGTFGTPASTATTGFGTFGTPATTASTGFGTGFSSFGTPAPASTTTNLFSGFGTNTTTTASGFTGFGTAAPLQNTGFTGFGTQTTSAPSFSGFGSTFGAKPTTATGFGSFGTTLGGTTLGQPLGQQQPAPDPNQALYNSIFNCNVFGDERDAVLAKWNLLQASWGVGKGYYSQSQHPVEYTQQNPYCRFKAIGYSVIPGHDNKEGLTAIVFNKKEAEIKSQKDQLITSLATILGNKPNLSISVHNIRAISDSKTQVLVYIQERGMTGCLRKIPASDLANYLLQPMQKQQLVSIGADNVFAHVMPDSDQLKEYLSKAPAGVDIRIWKQAQLDNPDSTKYIPVPLVGFEQLKWRSKCQEKETGLHRGFLEQVSQDIIDLKRRHAASVAQISEQKHKLLELQHRVLQILVKQEITRKAGIALQPEEEVLKGQLENMQTQISVPTQFKGRLNELLAQIRMQNKNGQIASLERYNMEPAAQEDIKEFLRMEQNGINHLVEIINSDLSHLKTIRDGMQELIQRH